jgi:hypothetical protein
MIGDETATRRRTLIEMMASPPQAAMKINPASVVVINEVKAMNGPTI